MGLEIMSKECRFDTNSQHRFSQEGHTVKLLLTIQTSRHGFKRKRKNPKLNREQMLGTFRMKIVWLGIFVFLA